MTKYLYTGIAFALLVSVTSCQSDGNKNNATQQTASSNVSPTHTQVQTATAPAPEMIKDVAKKLPPFKFYKVKSGIEFTNSDIPSGKTSAFILFDPNCGHCQHEAGLLAKNYQKLENINIYFVSMNEPALMASFLETFGKELAGKPNVEVLYDRNQEFIQKIHVPEQFPANYIYGADGTLKNHWEGEKDIDFVVNEFTK